MAEAQVLNLEQKKVVEYPSNKKWLCVIACPGSGKTHCLVSRVHYLIRQSRSHVPVRFLIVAFNNEAAQEIKRRLQEVPISPWVQIYCGTFHGMAKRLLLESQSWIDEPHHVDESPYRLVHRLLQPKALSNHHFQFHHILVDEFQDVNAVQHDLVHLLSLQAKTVMIVGDPDQNIYEFRASSVAFLYSHTSDVEHCETMFLCNNYRSNAPIVALANAVRDVLKDMQGTTHKDVEHSEENKLFIPIIPAMISQMLPESDDDLQPVLIYYPSIPWMNHRIIQDTLAFLEEFENPSIAIICRQNWGLEILAKNTHVNFQQALKKGTITLSTIHAAKGRQWDVVCLCHLNGNYFPDQRALPEEEWRLFFEAITRPKHRLLLYNYAYQPSEFTLRLDPKLFHQVNPEIMIRTTFPSPRIASRGPLSLSVVLKQLKGTDYVHVKQWLPLLTTLVNPIPEVNALEQAKNAGDILYLQAKILLQDLSHGKTIDNNRLGTQLKRIYKTESKLQVALTHWTDVIDLYEPHRLYFCTKDISLEYRISLNELIRILYCTLEFQGESKKNITSVLVHNLSTLQITEIDLSKWEHGKTFHLWLSNLLQAK